MSAKPPVVLGVSALYHDAAAAVVRGGEIVAAAQEERFTRTRHDARYPQQAVAWCLAEVGGASAIDAVAYYEDPALAFDRVLKSAIEAAPGSEAIWPAAAVLQLGEKLTIAEPLTRHLGPRAADQLYFVDHHLSHAASAFHPSPFSEAAIVVVDGVGEWASTSIAHGRDRAIEMRSQIHYPHSLGLLYAAFTHHCGLKVNSGEYKLMGLAPYGQPRHVQRILDDLIDLRDDGSFCLNTTFFGHLDSFAATNERFEAWAGCPRREPEGQIRNEHMDLAASVQAVIDEALWRICRQALTLCNSTRLCLAGGVALNCVAVGRLARRLPALDGLWIQPAAGDAGGALGAALQVAHEAFGAPRHQAVGRHDAQQGSFLGPAYGSEAIEQSLTDVGVVVQHRFDDEDALARHVAQALADGAIVGRFDGRMEFGPRALGNRSILADARRTDGQLHLNLRIKYRESWRPFAPIVARENAHRYFELDEGEDSPYMLRVAHVRPELRREVDWAGFRDDGGGDMVAFLQQPRSTIPAVTHVDHSARVQTVDRQRHPTLHKLLREFEAITGCGVLINTSFNRRGEPIVCAPKDAIDCFLATGIDVLAIGPFIVRKSDQPEALRALEGTVRFEPD
jgi:carbamoyltransferase